MLSDPINYIVGGSDANIEDYPYQALLLETYYLYEYPVCGGSIISDLYILTAAHCIKFTSTDKLRVGVGSNKVENTRKYRVKQIIVHESYSSKRKDIGLLKLNSPLRFSRAVQPIDLPYNSLDELPSSAIVTVSGWGDLSFGDLWGPDTLQHVDIAIIEQSICNESYFGLIKEWEICAGYLGVGGKDSCQGDSGGPLASYNTLYGIVTWGIGCGESDYPGVYTNVAYFRDWITSKTGI